MLRIAATCTETVSSFLMPHQRVLFWIVRIWSRHFTTGWRFDAIKSASSSHFWFWLLSHNIVALLDDSSSSQIWSSEHEPPRFDQPLHFFTYKGETKQVVLQPFFVMSAIVHQMTRWERTEESEANRTPCYLDAWCLQSQKLECSTKSKTANKTSKTRKSLNATKYFKCTSIRQQVAQYTDASVEMHYLSCQWGERLWPQSRRRPYPLGRTMVTSVSLAHALVPTRTKSQIEGEAFFASPLKTALQTTVFRAWARNVFDSHRNDLLQLVSSWDLMTIPTPSMRPVGIPVKNLMLCYITRINHYTETQGGTQGQHSITCTIQGCGRARFPQNEPRLEFQGIFRNINKSLMFRTQGDARIAEMIHFGSIQSRRRA